MPGEELYEPIDSAASDRGHEALTMAFALIADRVQRLNQSHRDEFFQLLKVLRNADPQGIERCVVTMREILEQCPSPSRRIDYRSESNSPRLGRSSWIPLVNKQIARERAAAGLTQAKFAEKAGLLQGQISKLETGRHKPTHLTIFKIAQALGRPVSVFDR